MAGLIAGLGAFFGGALALRKAEQEVDDLVSDKSEQKAVRKAESVGREVERQNEKERTKTQTQRERNEQRRLDLRLKHGIDKPASATSSSSSASRRGAGGGDDEPPSVIEVEVSGMFGKSWKVRHAKVFYDHLILSDSATAKVPSERIPLKGSQPHLDTSDGERRIVRLTTGKQPPTTHRFRCKDRTQAAALRRALQRCAV